MGEDPTSAHELEPGARRQLREVVGLVRQALGSDVVGAWLTGSALAGGLRPSSDLERRRLVDGLLALSGRRAAAGPSRSIELTIAVWGDVRPWRSPPMDLQYGDWWRAELESGHAWPSQRGGRR